jgi:hypothetical protein
MHIFTKPIDLFGIYAYYICMKAIKTCYKCRLTLPVSCFSKAKSRKDGLQNHCKSCVKKYCAENKDAYKKYCAENKDAIKERMAKYRAENKDSIKKQLAKYRAENKDAIKERMAKYHAFTCSTLHDSYIKHLIIQRSPLTPSDIPQSLVELKRAQLLIARKLKEI